MQINHLLKVKINDSEQWILVRGKNADNPLIIHVQAGPGLPMIPEAASLEKMLQFENSYLVAYWDQRACGKSYSRNIDAKTINLSQLTDDVLECTKYLLKRYNKDKAILIGYSIGATLGLMAAAQDSSLFTGLFLVGIDIDIPTANKYALEFIISKSGNNKKQLKQANELGKAPITNAKLFQQRAKLITNLGGIKARSNYNQLLLSTIWNMITSRAYRIIDIPKTVQGMEFCQNALLPEMNNLNLFDKIKSIDVPVHFIQGKLDGIAPYQTAAAFYEYLQADVKTFTGFENSAHMPHYDEPEKFSALIKETVNKISAL